MADSAASRDEELRKEETKETGDHDNSSEPGAIARNGIDTEAAEVTRAKEFTADATGDVNHDEGTEINGSEGKADNSEDVNGIGNDNEGASKDSDENTTTADNQKTTVEEDNNSTTSDNNASDDHESSTGSGETTSEDKDDSETCNGQGESARSLDRTGGAGEPTAESDKDPETVAGSKDNDSRREGARQGQENNRDEAKDLDKKDEGTETGADDKDDDSSQPPVKEAKPEQERETKEDETRDPRHKIRDKDDAETGGEEPSDSEAEDHGKRAELDDPSEESAITSLDREQGHSYLFSTDSSPEKDERKEVSVDVHVAPVPITEGDAILSSSYSDMEKYMDKLIADEAQQKGQEKQKEKRTKHSPPSARSGDHKGMDRLLSSSGSTDTDSPRFSEGSDHFQYQEHPSSPLDALYSHSHSQSSSVSSRKSERHKMTKYGSIRSEFHSSFSFAFAVQMLGGPP